MNFLTEINKWAKVALAGLTLLCSMWNIHATGLIPLNAPQSGTLNFVTNGNSPLIITNQFVPGFTYPPVIQFYLTSGFTNALPVTNTFTTTTNFALEVATPTNCTVNWTAFAGYPRVTFGTNVSLVNAPTNIAFPFAFAQIPSVNVEPNQTNYPVAITAITTTNFTVTAIGASFFYWAAFGIAAAPGSAPITY